MARTGAFTNWVTLSSDQGQMPEVIEAVTIERPAGGGTYDTFYYATQETTYRLISPAVYVPRLKSVGSIVSQLGNGQGRVTIRLQNGDLGFRDDFAIDYVTSAGRTEASGSDMFIGSKVTIRRILIGEVSASPVETDLIFMFGTVTGARYTEEYLELDVATDVNLAPTLSNRRVGSKCPWVFKGTECGYSGGLTTCNKLYTDAGGCSGRSNQHRFGGFPARDSAASIGRVSGLGSPATYQLVQIGSDYTQQRMITAFDDSFAVTDDSANDRTVVTSITPDWVNAASPKYRVAADLTLTTGTVSSGSSSLTVASATGWKVGHGIRVIGAGTVAGTSTLNGSINSSVTTITLASTSNFAASGMAKINNEIVYYHGKTSTQLQNVVRAYNGTSAASHTNGATVTPFVDLVTTVSAISGSTFTLVNAAGTSVTSQTVYHDDTAAILEAFDDAYTAGKPLYVPAGDYWASPLIFDSKNRVILKGDGPGRTTFHSIHPEPIIVIDTTTATSHTVTIENFGFVGTSTGALNHGIRVRDTGGNGVFNLTLRNLRFNDVGGSAVKTESGANAAFTILLEALDVDQQSIALGHGIDLWGSNDTTLIRCYVHNVADSKAAYRVRSGSVTMIGCNGIDGGNPATWGLFGNNTAEDGTDNYCRVNLIGCNVEAFTDYGIRCKAGSYANFFSTQVIAPTSGTVTPIKFDYVTTDQAGIFDALSGVQTMGASYTNSQAVHSDGMPFIQLGHREFSTFYDTNGAASATIPGISGSRITGSQNYAMTHAGYQKLSGHMAMEEQSSPVTAPANTGFLFAKDAGGQTGLYWVSDGVTERRIDAASVSLTATRIGFGDGSNVLTGSANFTWDDAAKALTVTKAGANPAIYVTDTTNSVTARLGTIAGLSPDQAIVGSQTNHPFVIYQNNMAAWGVNTDKHWRPYDGNNTQDIGTTAVKPRTLYLGTSLDLGNSASLTGELILRNATNSNTTTIKAGAAGANLVFTWPTDDGTNGQALTTDGNGVLSWTTITGGGGGTVTSVALSLPSIFTVSGSPVTSSGTLTGTLATQVKNSIFAGPSTGVDATPTFRSLVDDDIPNVLTVSKISNLTSNGFVKTSAGDGTLSVDTNTYLTANQTITLSGDVTGSGSTLITTAIAAGVIVDADINASAAISISKLAASAITIAGTSTSLGGSISRDTITGLSTTGVVKRTGANTLTAASIVNADIDAAAAIAVSKLAASTISGITLGSNLNTLTISTGLSGSSYNGSATVTIAIDSTVATLSGSQTLSNKTLSSAILTGTLTAGGGVGTNGQFLQSTGTGVQWATVTAGATPGGSDTQVQFNDGGSALGGDAGFTYNKTTNTATVEQLNLGTAGSARGILRLRGNTSGEITVQPAATAGTYTLTLPQDDGNANQVLTTDGSGVLSWSTPSSGGRTTLTANRTYYVGFDLGTCTISNASPGVVTTTTNHNLQAGDPVILSTTGTLPAPLIAGAVYYVVTVLSATTFTVSLTPSGAAVNTTSAGSGTHRVRTGKDTNDGLTSSRTGAVLTINKAIELACGIDMASFAVTIKLANGRYAESLRPGSYVGVGPITILGDATTPSNVTIEPYSAGQVTLRASDSRIFREKTTTFNGAPQASPVVVNYLGHELVAGDIVKFTTTGTLPSPLTAGTAYYVLAIGLTASTFRVATTPGGTAINTTTMGAGTHRVQLPNVLANGTPVQFEMYLPAEAITMKQTYYVVNATSETFQISNTLEGSAVTWASNPVNAVYCGSYVVYMENIIGKYIMRGVRVGTNLELYGMRMSNAGLEITQCDFAGKAYNFGHVWSESNANVNFTGTWSISQSTGDFMLTASDSGYMSLRTSTLTINGSLSAASGFAWGYRTGVILCDAATYINASSLTGPKGLASVNGVLRGSNSVLPGSSNVTAINGGFHENFG